jgi:quercetin dioxygenase-like cupin family protein
MAALTTMAAGAPAGAAGGKAGTRAAQSTGVTRTDLQRHDLSIPGWETIQARVDIAPGAAAPRHSHPGEEIIYVLEGAMEYQVADGPWRTFAVGEVLLIPAGVIHAARNTGTVNAAELATYVVEKGKPLIVLAD